MAKADDQGNKDGEVTLDELEKTPIDLALGYDPSGFNAVNMKDFVSQLSRTTGHFRGEGECSVQDLAPRRDALCSLLMPRWFLRRLLPLLLGTHALLHGLACEDGGGGPVGAAGAPVNVDDLRYEGGVTDEAAQSMLGVSARQDASRVPVPQVPTEGAVLPAAAAPTFSWNASSARAPRLPSWLGPERAAHAHGTPFTGVAYLLTFRTPKNPALVRVATSKTSYTPDEAAWNDLKAAGEPISLSILVARLENNLIVPGGGPYASGNATTFSIAP
jgi:hypothetical protein